MKVVNSRVGHHRTRLPNFRVYLRKKRCERRTLSKLEAIYSKQAVVDKTMIDGANSLCRVVS